MSALVVLRGSPRERGLGQARACPDLAPAVRDAIRTRNAAAQRFEPFLAAQYETTKRLAPEALEEIAGIAEGFGLEAAEIFDFLHIGCLNDIALAPIDTDGCSAFARDGVVAKNRDFRPEHVALQRIFLHDDPAWGGRRMLCIGSLGAPGAWSSGMNSDGFALADTQIATADHGQGILRYFLMNALLASCTTVDDAIDLIRSMPHAGGGSLVMADATGAGAAVALRHRRVDIETGGTVVHTNHYLAAPDRLPAVAHSIGRLETLRAALAETPARDPRAMLALHAPTAVCRHPPDPSPTLAGAVWDTRTGVALCALGPPCSTPWRRFEPSPEGWRETHA